MNKISKKTFWVIFSITVTVVFAYLTIFTGTIIKQQNQILLSIKNMEQIIMNKDVEVIMTTSLGEITISLFSKEAPKTVANFISLATDGFYDDTRFHRVIKDFMIQGGDPLSKSLEFKEKWGEGGPGYTFEDEFNNKKIKRGVLAMANSGPNTNGSQFFIVTIEEAGWLDGKHTVFGEVIDGMDIVDKIEESSTDEKDRPIEDVFVRSVVVTEK